MKGIPLTQGKYALVDDEDFVYLNSFKWYARKSPHTFYALRHPSLKDNPNLSHRERQAVIYMHRIVANIAKNKEVDHINHNGLDNRKSNIRSVTRTENNRNMRLRHDSSSGERGVNKLKTCNRWGAYIRVSGKRKHLGLFKTKEEAVLARKQAEGKYYGIIKPIQTC